MVELSNHMAFTLLKNGIIEEKDFPIYRYGLENLLASITGFSSMIIIGSIFGKFIETILFIFVYSCLRKYAGGYHASTHFKCYLTSMFTYILFLACLLVLTNRPSIALMSPLFLGDIVLLTIAPTQNLTNNKSNEKLRSYRKHMIKWLIIFNIISLVMFTNEFLFFHSFVINYTVAILAVASILSLKISNLIVCAYFVYAVTRASAMAMHVWFSFATQMPKS